MRVVFLLVCALGIAHATYNQWQGGTGNIDLNRQNTTIIHSGGGIWSNTGAQNNRRRRLELRNTDQNSRLQIEVVNQIATLGIYTPTTINRNIVTRVTVKNGGSIECDSNACRDGNSLYIGIGQNTQLSTLVVETGGRINRNGYGRINVSGYLGTVSNEGQILGEGIVLGMQARGAIGNLFNNAGGNISAVTGRAGSSIDTLNNALRANIASISNITFNQRLSNQGAISTITNIATPTLQNSGNITSLSNSTINALSHTGGSITTLSNSTIGTLNVSAGNVSNVTNNTIATVNVSGGLVSNVTNNAITNLNVTGGTVGLISNPQRGITNLNVSGGGSVRTIENIAITNLTNSGNITNLNGSASISALNNAGGTISNFTLNDNVGFNPNTNMHINGSITNLTIQDFNLDIQTDANVWNTHTLTNRGGDNEHLYLGANVGNLTVQPGAIKVAIGNNVGNGIYLYDKVILNAPARSINFSHLTPAQGLQLFDLGTGFSLSANATSSFGASALQSIQLNDTRRIVIIQNILDSVNFHHFYRTATKRKTQKDSIQTDSQEQEIDTSKWQKHRTFAIPYGLYGNLSVNNTKSNTYAGGILSGIQKDLGTRGIGIAYVGYEYNNTKSQLSVSDAFLVANVLSVGLAHIKSFSLSENTQLYIKSNLRGSVSFLKLDAKEDRNNYNASTYGYHLGGELRSGVAYYLNQASYLSPEIGLSYDLLGVVGFEIDKGNLANEIYPTHYIHLPQVSASMKYYKAVGQFYRFSALLGGRYSPNNTPTLSFQNGIFSDEAKITLPSYYANININIARAIDRVSELSAGYNGLAYNGGSSHSISIKYIRWF